MKRLSWLVAVVAMASGALLGARLAERATWVLTNGERISGIVNSHTDAQENISRGEFAVGTNDGKETEVKVDQVAVIEFVGGNAPNAELEKLPPNGHMIAMRDGATHPGRLINLIRGDLVRWQHSSRNTEDIPIRQVARVYLNTDNARRIYNYTPPAANANAGSAGGTTASAPAIPNGPGIVVRADQQWTDTGNNVARGERIKFIPSGQIRWGANADMLSGPDGSGAVHNIGFPVPTMNVGALIGRVGNGQAFAIGSGPQPIAMPDNGRLYLGVNDSEVRDNAGGFRVQIQRGVRYDASIQ
jgi:hypothetical protein